MQLRNIYSKEDLRKKLAAEKFSRKTLSFYRYVIIHKVDEFRDRLYADFTNLNILGRIYVAQEGINAQINVPDPNWEAFLDYLKNSPELKNMPLKIAVEDSPESFLKLIVRKKNKIVADGLSDNSYDVTNVGRHLNAEEFNHAIDNGAMVIDMRNHYESEVGYFENAIKPDADTFRQAMYQAIDLAKGNEEKEILLYCTGGIRCEKASAWFKHNGFKNVNQLYGGIIEYAKEIKEKKLPNRFKGKNFVFDQRMGERISNEIVSACHQCGNPCDTHVNCANDDCHLLFIQCDVCKQNTKGCCTPECQTIFNLPIEEQIKLRKGKTKQNAHAVYKSRLRPNLKKVLEEKKSSL